MQERRICIYGTASRSAEYVRNRLLERALEASGFRIVPCVRPLWSDTDGKIAAAGSGIAAAAGRFLLAHLVMIFRYLFLIPDHEAVLVLAPGHPDVPFARFASWLRGKPLIFDAFYSLYDTVVEDRGLAAPGSTKARMVSFLDRLSCRIADSVLIDTKANRDYICEKYGFDPARFTVIPAGAPEGFEESEEGVPGVATAAGTETFTVLFQGSYVPLQGADIVVRAAAILKDRMDIQFRMIGSGQTRGTAEAIACSEGLHNIEFLDWMTLEQLKEETKKADVCLGIFGTSGKAHRVIPHKVYAALAMGKPVITADSPAACELLEDGVSALLCLPGDPAALSEKIVELADNPDLRFALSREASILCTTRFDTAAIARRLAEALPHVVKSN